MINHPGVLWTGAALLHQSDIAPTLRPRSTTVILLVAEKHEPHAEARPADCA